MNNKRQLTYLNEFAKELPFTLNYFQPDNSILQLAGTTALDKNFFIYLDFAWEIYYQGEVFIWDNKISEINMKLSALMGSRIVDIIGPENVYDATYMLEGGGMIRSVTSDDQYATEWSLRVVSSSGTLFTGEIYPHELAYRGTEFSTWDLALNRLPVKNKSTFPGNLVGSTITGIDLIKSGQLHNILQIELRTKGYEEVKLHFWDSQALYTDNQLLVDNATQDDIQRFAREAVGNILDGFRGTEELGFYGCSLIFGSVRLRQIGSSEAKWCWQIRDAQGKLLWRAPTDTEVNQGNFYGISYQLLVCNEFGDGFPIGVDYWLS